MKTGRGGGIVTSQWTRRGAIFLIVLMGGYPAWAGTTRDFTTVDFSAGVLDNVEVQDGYLTLYAGWGSQSSSLSLRYHMGMSYDGLRGKTVIYGGHDHDGFLFGDTWSFDFDAGWIDQNPTVAPSARYGHGLVWAGEKFVLFGGINSAGDYLDETWTYDLGTNEWTQLVLSTAPEARAHFAMGYDSDLNQVVVMGGQGTGGGSVNAYTWVFHVDASSWTRLSISPGPSVRTEPCMTYDQSVHRMILFGGRDSYMDFDHVYGDTWALDLSSGVWEERSPTGSPSPRTDANMLYDGGNERAVLFGGRDSETGYRTDTYFYQYQNDRWQLFSGEPGYPPGRYGHGMTYHQAASQGMIFGGKRDVASNLLRFFTVKSSGTWESPVVDAWAGYVSSSPAPVAWKTLTTTFFTHPAGTDVFMQLASSTDGVTFEDYRGPDGSTDTFYVSPVSGDIWSGHQNRRYMKMKVVVRSDDPPLRPQISQLQVSFNRAPLSPVLTSPADHGLINDDTPNFAWTAPVDEDGDTPLTYQIQVDDTADFSSPFLAQSSVTSISYTTTTALTEGVWYWRVRACDSEGFYGDWSTPFQLTLDTHTPPGAVTELTAVMGAGNGSIALNWVFPGDDKGDVSGGTVLVHYSVLGPIDDEGAWSGSAERAFGLTASAGESLQTTVTNLVQATTYYFAIKTRDEIGNESPLSTASPACMTNAAPTITLIAPLGGEYVVGTTTLSWIASDPNPGDTLKYYILLSQSAAEINYSYLIASDLPHGTTHYLWDSRAVPNGNYYRVRVDAFDQRVLKSSDSSDSAFWVDNVNEPPVVSFVSPVGGQTVYGDFPVSWSIQDPNVYDNHFYHLYLSSDSGAHYTELIASTTLNTYEFATRDWKNADSYQLRIVATDSGSPPLTSSATTPLFRISNSAAPEAFHLTKPLEDDYPSVFDLMFAWERSVDPERGRVFYTLRYSTQASLAGAVELRDLDELTYTPSVGSLQMETTYYWQVTARDEFYETRQSAVGAFMLSRYKAWSSDKNLLIEILEGLPPDAYISFEDAQMADRSLLMKARQDSKGDRLIKLVESPAWDVRLKNASGHVVTSESVLTRLTIRYPNSLSWGVPAADNAIDYLRIASLNEARPRWEIVPDQSVSASSQERRATTRGLAIYSLVASAAGTGLLSGINCFPNPFSAGHETTRIRYVLTEDSDVTVRIYTLMGDLVRTYDVRRGTVGGIGTALGYTNEISWDGYNGNGEVVANGMYLVQISVDAPSGTIKRTLRVGVVK